MPVLVLAGALFLFGRQFKVTVPVAPSVSGTAVNAVTGTIEVRSQMDIRVKAQRRGWITENVVKPGTEVEGGDILARQDARELQLHIEQVQIRLAAALARDELESVHQFDLENLQEQLAGMELAVELKQAPVSKLESLRRDVRKNQVLKELDQINKKEGIELLRNQLLELELQQEQMTTRAPYPGVVAELYAWKGDLINANQDLLRLVSRGRFVIMELTEEDYFGVRDEQSVTLRLASYPDRTFSGVVTRLADVANANNKTRNVIIDVDAPDEVLVPGLTGEGYLVKDERKDAILIPRRALIGNTVYVVKGGRVQVRRVKAGFLGLNQAEIVEGIEIGETVVLEDQNLLEPGQRVRPLLNP